MGKAVLLVSLELDEVMNLSDRILVEFLNKFLRVLPDRLPLDKTALLIGGLHIPLENQIVLQGEVQHQAVLMPVLKFAVDKAPAQPGETVLKISGLTVPSKVHRNNAVKDARLFIILPPRAGTGRRARS